MIITSHMQKIIQIHPCLLKLSRKQESAMDGHYYYIPHPCKYLKQGFWGKILVFGWKITNFENCVLFMQ
jgi:hypothetical protein